MRGISHTASMCPVSPPPLLARCERSFTEQPAFDVSLLCSSRCLTSRTCTWPLEAFFFFFLTRYKFDPLEVRVTIRVIEVISANFSTDGEHLTPIESIPHVQNVFSSFAVPPFVLLRVVFFPS